MQLGALMRITDTLDAAWADPNAAFEFLEAARMTTLPHATTGMPMKAFVEGCSSALVAKAVRDSEDQKVGGHAQYGTCG
ncbi:hypothetical protein Ndes2437B_g00577 [Nannochloris sp. 'desiccata']